MAKPIARTQRPEFVPFELVIRVDTQDQADGLRAMFGEPAIGTAYGLGPTCESVRVALLQSCGELSLEQRRDFRERLRHRLSEGRISKRPEDL